MENIEDIHGIVNGNIYGTVKGNITGDVQGTINGLEWKKLYLEGAYDALTDMQEKLENQEDIIHDLLAELYELKK